MYTKNTKEMVKLQLQYGACGADSVYIGPTEPYRFVEEMTHLKNAMPPMPMPMGGGPFINVGPPPMAPNPPPPEPKQPVGVPPPGYEQSRM